MGVTSASATASGAAGLLEGCRRRCQRWLLGQGWAGGRPRRAELGGAQGRPGGSGRLIGDLEAGGEAGGLADDLGGAQEQGVELDRADAPGPGG